MKDSRQNKWRKQAPDIFWACMVTIIVGAFALGKTVGEHGLTFAYIEKKLTSPLWQDAFVDENTSDPVGMNGNAEENQQTEPTTLEKKDEAEKIDSNAEKKTEAKAEQVNGKQTEQKEKTEKKEDIGVTKFDKYTPVKINSPYYSDRGKTPLTTEYKYSKKAGKSYFKDAMFIGDSRMVAFYDYLDLKDTADFYCQDGYALYDWVRGKSILCKNTNRAENLNQVLQNKKYGKVYIMLGMNDLGYGNTEIFRKRMDLLIEEIKKTQPNAVIYLMGMLHFSKGRSDSSDVYNNININDKNVELAKAADGKQVFYIDVNPLFTDEKGYLKEGLSADGCHMYGVYYEKWYKYLKEHVVVKKQEKNAGER